MKKAKKIFTLFLAILSLTICLTLPAAAAQQIHLDKYYFIASALNENMVVDVSGGGHEDGGNIQLYEKNGTDAQLFKFVRSEVDGYYYIVNKGSEKVLDVAGGDTSSQTNVQLYTKNGTQAQHWKPCLAYNSTTNVSFMARCGKFLDVSGGNTANGTNIWIYDGNNTLAQAFRLIPADGTDSASAGGSSSATQSQSAVKYVKTSNPANGLYMRSAPSSSASVITKLSYGTQVNVLSANGSWSKVTANGKTGYVASQYLSSSNPNGTSNSSSGLVSPVSGGKFSKKTNDNGWYGFHDINRNVSTSTPVCAITDGTAYFYQFNTGGKLRSYGNYVKFISIDGQYEVRYAHLSRFNGMPTPITADTAYPCSGAKSNGYVGSLSVSAGTTLGYVGTTGNSSGVHLHIEIYKNGTRVDPTTLFPNLA